MLLEKFPGHKPLLSEHAKGDLVDSADLAGGWFRLRCLVYLLCTRETIVETKFFKPRKEPIKNVINVLRSHIERNLGAYEEDMAQYAEVPEEEDIHYPDDEPEPAPTPEPPPVPPEPIRQDPPTIVLPIVRTPPVEIDPEELTALVARVRRTYKHMWENKDQSEPPTLEADLKEAAVALGGMEQLRQLFVLLGGLPGRHIEARRLKDAPDFGLHIRKQIREGAYKDL